MKNEKGFTITELLIAMLIGGIVMAAAYSSFISQQKSYQTTESVSFLQQNLRASMYFISKDLRMAGFNPGKELSFGFTSITANSVTFTMDSNENNTLDTGETITYDIDSNNLRRNAGAGAQPIADNITSMVIEYFDLNGNETTVVGNVRSVSVTLAASDGDHTRDLSTLIKCRNMGL